MKNLIPDQINSKLDEIVTKCFEGNRIADRGMSVLAVNFALNKTESLLHKKLAHLFPQLADVVSSFQGSRNNLTFYGLTPPDNSNYNTPLEFFEKMLDYTLELEALISETALYSRDEDIPAYSFLLGFVKQINPVVNQCLLLVDKAEQFGDRYCLFDASVEDFIIL